MQPEARISRDIRKLVKERGGFCFKVWGSEMMMAGLPDLICCYRGLFVAFEVKTPVGRLSQRQRYVLRVIQDRGGIAAVPRSVRDASDVLDRIDASLGMCGHVTDALSAGLLLQIDDA